MTLQFQEIDGPAPIIRSPSASAPQVRVCGGGRPVRKVFLNGKFYSGVLNGVHRTADRLVRQLDALSADGECPDLDLRLLLPRRRTWAPELVRIRKMPQAFGHHQVWEQCILPFVAADGVLVNLATLAPLAHACKLSMVHDAQFLISPESFPPRFRLGYKLLTPLISATSARVLTVSEYARDSLSAFHVARHDKTEVIYNGADHITEAEPDRRILARLGLQALTFALLFGTPATYKNIQVVFEAFRIFPPSLRLVVVGSSRLSLIAAGLQPPPNAIFVGTINDRELRALYEQALCLLFPSRTEGFGLPPAEAMACGCPVVAAPAGAMPEICRDAVLYADIFSPRVWAMQVTSLLRQPELRRAKIAAGLLRASDFTWRKAGLRLLENIRQAMQR